MAGITKLKKKLWALFSQYIRMRDKGICFTCNKKLPDYYDRQGNKKPGWKSGQAGHFITAATCGPSLYFNEKNVHCQCYHCNINLSGNWVLYEKNIIERYGHGVCEELKLERHKINEIWKQEKYEEKIIEYKNKIKFLEQGGYHAFQSEEVF